MVSRKRQPLPALGQDSVEKQQKRKRSQPLAALEQGSGEKQEKRSQAGMRVQYFGQRISCTSVSLAQALKKTLKETRASRTTWTAKHWNFVVQKILQQKRKSGILLSHGGTRKRKKGCGSSAVGEKQLRHGGTRKTKTKCGSSSVGTRATCRQEPTEAALVVSAVGEERAEACVDEKSAEVEGAS